MEHSWKRAGPTDPGFAVSAAIINAWHPAVKQAHGKNQAPLW